MPPRREYNHWVIRETVEDFALRFTPVRFRTWSAGRVANTALGAASFLVLEAVGATLLVEYGFINAFWAILGTGLLIFLAGLPISVYAARYGVDMDLLTRGAGFGYIGSTITSLIYASFTFIFFALEAAVMAYALELALDIPPRWGYLICALVVIPLVTHGISAISRLQLWTQPLWLVMWLLPFAVVLSMNPEAFAGLSHYAGESGQGGNWNLHLFGAALTVGIALVTQMGEQADYLRFMPEARSRADLRWWTAVLVGGTGWVFIGVLKMLGGAALAYLAMSHAVPSDRAVDPNQMYLAAYEYVFPSYGWAVAATALFVVVSQLKINVTNAYAGSLAWSNFFARLTHSHPGRVVWVVFNCLIAFMLMEMDVFQALGDVLGLYSNIAIAWMMAVVADLVINKPLGLSPPGIEFKRAHLFDINPVGTGAMALASALSIAAYLGLFGPLAQAFSALVALGTALVASPLIAWATGGRYYLARLPKPATIPLHAAPPDAGHGATATGFAAPAGPQSQQTCVVCEHPYEGPDMAHCPVYQGPICSLCCSLDARCEDACKPEVQLGQRWAAALRRCTPQGLWPYLDEGLGRFVLLMGATLPIIVAAFVLIYRQVVRGWDDQPALQAAVVQGLQSGFTRLFAMLLLLTGIVAWWLVLAGNSRRVAQRESIRQTELLMQEMARREATEQALHQANQAAEEARALAEQANQAKSRYISAISHELRTPLNSILGYSQLLSQDADVPTHRRQALRVIQRGGEHLLSLIEGTLDMASIESGRIALAPRPLPFAHLMQEIAGMFELQAEEKGLYFHYEVLGALPDWVRGDDKRLRQIVFNLLGNAVKFTRQGGVRLRVRHALEMAQIEVADTGPGMQADEVARIFEPFHRGQRAPGAHPLQSGVPISAEGAGLGLTIAKMLTDLMGGALSVSSTPGEGSVFTVRLFLPEIQPPAQSAVVRRSAPPQGYAGPRRALLTVDNEDTDRQLLKQLLQPLGFEIREAASGHDALDLLASGYAPDALFLDLAMPGIDGWETLRRIRALQGKQPVVAIVSANAFEKSAIEKLPPSSADIQPDDFLVKPVRHRDLLAWLERRLALQWTYEPAAPKHASGASPSAVSAACEAPAAAASIGYSAPSDTHSSRPHHPVRPPDAALADLRAALQIGYLRGATHALEALNVAHPECSDFLSRLDTLVRNFQFDVALARLDTPSPALPESP